MLRTMGNDLWMIASTYLIDSRILPTLRNAQPECRSPFRLGISGIPTDSESKIAYFVPAVGHPELYYQYRILFNIEILFSLVARLNGLVVAKGDII